MSKRKILLMALALCMVAILAVGGTLAYLTDEEVKHNVFTVGNVDIDLDEGDFVDGTKLLPDIAVDKVVNVKNVGSEEAYVRVHIGIPTYWLQSNEDDTSVLYYIKGDGSEADGEWKWTDTYTCTVDGVEYKVDVATYTTALAAKNGETATPVIKAVCFGKLVTNKDIQDFTKLHDIEVLVAAEGGQVSGFNDAQTALNTQFGVPGKYTVDFTETAKPEE